MIKKIDCPECQRNSERNHEKQLWVLRDKKLGTAISWDGPPSKAYIAYVPMEWARKEKLEFLKALRKSADDDRWERILFLEGLIDDLLDSLD